MKMQFLIPALACLLTLAVCAQGNSVGDASKIGIDTPKEGTLKIKITVGKTVLNATLLDNPTTRAFAAKLPLTLPMQDLYSREMCYRFPDALPTDNVRNTGYEVGEIIYWPPRHSIVIMYVQNGEHFSMQKVGLIESGVEVFKTTGDTNVTFEVSQ
jgi:hypothetical protein